ncbi:MAG: gliding motility-associated ABC transporter substrate-binding protein GldG [Tenacibaculum sp.]
MLNKNTQHLVLLIAILLVLNLLSGSFYKRFDLTQDKRYTLSKVSKSLLDKIEKPLLIKVYLKGELPPEFKRLQIETRQFLDQLKAHNKHVSFKIIKPNNTEKLIKKGLLPSQLSIEENGKLSKIIIFPWATISYSNKTELVSLLPDTSFKTQNAQLQHAVEKLEYSFANALSAVLNTDKQKIAVLKGNGQLKDTYLYSILSSLKSKYKLAKFNLDSAELKPRETLHKLNQYNLIFIAKPTEQFTEKEKLVLDQFTTNGGNSIWMIDNNYSDTDSLYKEGKMMAFPRNLNLTDLLFSYQIRINNKLVQDLNSAKIPLATGNIGNQTQYQHLNWFYYPLVSGNPNHPITQNIAPVRFQFSTQIDLLKGGIKKTPLLVSSKLSKKVGTPTFIQLSSIAKKIEKKQYTGKPELLGVLLEGKFTSAYKNRVKPFKLTNFSSDKKQSKMIVIADGDLAKNDLLKGKPFDLSKDKWSGEHYGNKDFLINAIDYMLGNTELVNLRNKTLQIKLINKQKAYTEKRYWQLYNTTLPLGFLLIFALVFTYYRKRKYTV